MSLGAGAILIQVHTKVLKQSFPKSSFWWIEENKNALDGRGKSIIKLGEIERYGLSLEHSEASCDDNFMYVYSGLSTLLTLKAGYQLCN